VVPVEALQENAAWSAASRFSRGDPHSVDALDGCLQSSLARLRLGGVGHLRRFHPHALHICCPIFGPGRPALARGLGRKDRDLRSPVNFGHGTAVCARTLGKSRGMYVLTAICKGHGLRCTEPASRCWQVTFGLLVNETLPLYVTVIIM
jgi:hypothetical protein